MGSVYPSLGVSRFPKLHTSGQPCPRGMEDTPQTCRATNPQCSVGHGGCLGFSDLRQPWDWNGPELGLAGPPAPSSAFEDTKETPTYQQGGRRREQGRHDQSEGNGRRLSAGGRTPAPTQPRRSAAPQALLADPDALGLAHPPLSPPPASRTLPRTDCPGGPELPSKRMGGTDLRKPVMPTRHGLNCVPPKPYVEA